MKNNAAAWFNAQSFTGADRAWDSASKVSHEATTVAGYSNVPAEHHIHFCRTCAKDYPCASPHHRFDTVAKQLVPETPPRATKRCPECAFMGL